MMRIVAVLMLGSTLLALGTCLSVTKPPEPLRVAQSQQILGELLAHGRDGDWLVIRGYHATDDLVATVTNTPLSHVAVLDRGKEQVIEAEGKGVHLTKLADFVAKTHRLMLIRPKWARQGGDARALRRAYSTVGKKYDFLGTVGLNVPGRFYCSELAVYAYRDRLPRHTRFPPVIEPGKLYYYGRIIYDSGDRALKAAPDVEPAKLETPATRPRPSGRAAP